MGTLKSFYMLGYKPSLFILIKFEILASSFFKSVIRPSRFSDAIVTQLSSASIFGVMYSKQFSQSLMHNKNSKGPKHDPCGIPTLQNTFVRVSSITIAKLLPIGQGRSEQVVGSTIDNILS